ncbi:MAG: SCO family protein [Chthoniobacteraceae bacterium]
MMRVSPMENHSNRTALVTRFAFLCACIALPVSCERPPEPLKKMFQIPPFTLTERSGKPFTAPDAMRGKVWVADFFFASCPGVCLELSKSMASLHEAARDLPGARFLSISTDENDTPEVLRRYADQHGAGERWFFLTGPKTDIFKLSVGGFKLALADSAGVDVAEKFIHSSKLVLIDKAGWIRGYYDGIGENQADDAKRLLADIKRLLKEP